MPSGKFIAGLVLIGLAVPFIGIPIFTTPPLLTRESDSIEYRTESSNFNEERGYELSVGRGFTSLLIKLDIVMWNIPDNVDLVSLVAYDSEDSGATEYLLGEASPEDDEVSFTFRELGLAATSLGLSNPIYYLQAADGNHDDLDTANFKFAVTTLLPVLIGPIMAIVGLVLLFLGRGGGYSRIRRDPGRDLAGLLELRRRERRKNEGKGNVQQQDRSVAQKQKLLNVLPAALMSLQAKCIVLPATREFESRALLKRRGFLDSLFQFFSGLLVRKAKFSLFL
ncbi:MAG: hypothetical protein ACXADX_10700 [Candidatus Hodarchaeales archaeon]|jgi:hypothetical protein